MKREFLEELGVPVEVGELVHQGEFTNRGRRYRLMAFEVLLLSHDFCLGEHQRLNWFSLEEAQSLSMAGSDRQILAALLQTVREG